jgi:hypothetical protein
MPRLRNSSVNTLLAPSCTSVIESGECSRMLRIPVDECNTGGEGFKQAISPAKQE